jgi:putative SOS response-associated peptidase YedK
VLGGEATLAGQTAMYEKLAHSFGVPGRSDLAKAVEAQRRMIDMAVARIDTRINKLDLEAAIGNRMINARAEGLAEKPSFRVPLRRRRCLVPADGFYEWRQEGEGKPKTLMYVTLKSGEPFAFAGLWDEWHDPDADEPIRSFTIITTEPNEVLKAIHNRMPVILPRDAYDPWLDPNERQPDRLTGLLVPYPTEVVTAYPVSRTVNIPEGVHPILSGAVELFAPYCIQTRR